MTVSSLVNRVSWAGNGVTTTFAYTFRILDEDDLTVIVTTALGVESTKAIHTDYTVSGVGLSGGGNVACLTFTPATGETLTLLRELDLLQETDLTPNDPLPAETLETAYDRACMISQQLAESLGRVPMLKKSSPFSNLVLPEPSANMILTWNSGGTALENKAAADVGLTPVTAYIKTLLDDPDAATARTTLGAAATTDHNTLATAFHLEHTTAGTHADVTLDACTDFTAEHSAAGVHDSVRLVNLIPNSGLGVWSRSALAQGTTGRQTDYEAGADFVANGAFEVNTDNWTPADCTLSVAGAGESGNCLIITRTGGTLQYAMQALVGLTIGKLYKLTAWVYTGSSGNEAFFIRVLGAGSIDLGTTAGTSAAAWADYSVIFRATRTNEQVLLCKNTATAGTMKFDTVSVYEVNPGCVAADVYAPDTFTKTTTLDLLRVQQDTTHCVGLYGVKAIKSVNTAEYLDAFGSVYNLIEHYYQYRGRTVTFGCWVYSVTAAGNVKLVLTDSAGSTTSAAFCPADTLTWMEITHTVAAAATSFYPRVLFDGTAADVAYVSQPMLVFGPSIGSGNYCPPAKSFLPMEIAARLLSNVTISATTNVYFESASDGKLPKNSESFGASLQGACATANKYLAVSEGGFFSLGIQSQVANISQYQAGLITPASGIISLVRNDTFTGVSLDAFHVRI